MRRYRYPYNGKKYLANSNTSEIHDLDNEKDACQIDEIKHDHITMLDTEEEVVDYIDSYGYNGCAHCLSKYHTD